MHPMFQVKSLEDISLCHPDIVAACYIILNYRFLMNVIIHLALIKNKNKNTINHYGQRFA